MSTVPVPTRTTYQPIYTRASGKDVAPCNWARKPLNVLWAGGKSPTSPQEEKLTLDGGYPDCLRTLGPLLDIELDSLVFLERFVAVSLDFGVVDKHIRCAAIWSD